MKILYRLGPRAATAVAKGLSSVRRFFSKHHIHKNTTSRSLEQSICRSELLHPTERGFYKKLELRRTYHALARSLEEGYHSRPGLPIELVIYILRLAHCVVPCQRLKLYTHLPYMLHTTWAGTIEQTIWFSTPPLSRDLLARIAKIQFVTLSRDRCSGGWDNPTFGSWSWFEIVILDAQGDGEQTVKRRAVSGQDLAWISHGNRIAMKFFEWLEGIVFEPDHEIWGHIEEGDRIAVRSCAQWGGWSNHARKGFLKVDEWFEPTLPPRDS